MDTIISMMGGCHIRLLNMECIFKRREKVQ